MYLVDGGCDDVRTTRRAVAHEHRCQSQSRQRTSNNHGHKFLSLSQQFEWQTVLLLRNDILCKLQQEVEGQDSVDGLDQELEAQDFQRYDK